MDFGTVKARMDSGAYTQPGQFNTDMRLVFGNARKYNPPGSDVYHMAGTLLVSAPEVASCMRALISDGHLKEAWPPFRLQRQGLTPVCAPQPRQLSESEGCMRRYVSSILIHDTAPPASRPWQLWCDSIEGQGLTEDIHKRVPLGDTQ